MWKGKKILKNDDIAKNNWGVDGWSQAPLHH